MDKNRYANINNRRRLWVGNFFADHGVTTKIFREMIVRLNSRKDTTTHSLIQDSFAVKHHQA